jgi:hypothetical protein
MQVNKTNSQAQNLKEMRSCTMDKHLHSGITFNVLITYPFDVEYDDKFDYLYERKHGAVEVTQPEKMRQFCVLYG